MLQTNISKNSAEYVLPSDKQHALPLLPPYGGGLLKCNIKLNLALEASRPCEPFLRIQNTPDFQRRRDNNMEVWLCETTLPTMSICIKWAITLKLAEILLSNFEKPVEYIMLNIIKYMADQKW